jgi:hypothetical protein
MRPQPIDPRTEDTLVYELVRTDRASEKGETVGTATFSAGQSTVDAPESVAIAVRELLARGFVDRVKADERPRGYRRSGHGMVDMLVPGRASAPGFGRPRAAGGRSRDPPRHPGGE